jgi:hypothetical protein
MPLGPSFALGSVVVVFELNVEDAVNKVGQLFGAS